MYYDLNLKFNNNLEELLNESRRLGFSGVAIIQSSKKFKKDYIHDLKEFKVAKQMDIYSGVEIAARSVNDLKKKISSLRKKVDVLIVQGGRVKINRAACEDPRVDIISQPNKKRRDCGLNHILSKEAAKNQVAVEININSILQSRYSYRSKLFSQYRDILKLHEKFKFPIIITSAGTSIYDLRKPRDIIRLTQCFGMKKHDSVNSMTNSPTNILKRSKIRPEMIVNGVRDICTTDN
ncbi:MAG: RNase P subunit p30 family protein [Methanobacteriaceae archaeon]|nr:RNase P subunit p30 family protein [Methanobacteriaceae archaeon]